MTIEENMTEEERAEWWMFLNANPIGVDAGTDSEITKEDLGMIPENIRSLLWDDKTSAKIYLLCRSFNLSDDNTRQVARIVREITAGDRNARELRETLQNILGTPEIITQKLVQKLTEEFISPNYFQISRLFDKKHGTQPEPARFSGRPLETLNKESESPESDSSYTINKPSKNIVDLRKKGEDPNGLPPTPPPIKR